MGMTKTHYFGWFIVCPNRIDIEKYFPNEEFYRVYDEGQNKAVNDANILIPNRHGIAGCFSFDKYSDHPFQIFPVVNNEVAMFKCPEFILEGLKKLENEKATLGFGTFAYSS